MGNVHAPLHRHRRKMAGKDGHATRDRVARCQDACERAWRLRQVSRLPNRGGSHVFLAGEKIIGENIMELPENEDRRDGPAVNDAPAGPAPDMDMPRPDAPTPLIRKLAGYVTKTRKTLFRQ
ncbi:hypothetical protein [Novacetimonas pomaceti]|uniref:hypothetical protein n=1 Tax=Novacetimonas pomaceti TaxID=2021998 RepID=UPI00105822F3|nr:hypothetical protein [Novacetimonas pomaceti]